LMKRTTRPAQAEKKWKPPDAKERAAIRKRLREQRKKRAEEIKQMVANDNLVCMAGHRIKISQTCDRDAVPVCHCCHAWIACSERWRDYIELMEREKKR
jgi:hypothetical protein